MEKETEEARKRKWQTDRAVDSYKKHFVFFWRNGKDRGCTKLTSCFFFPLQRT